MLSEHERYCGLGMDALVIVCSRNTNFGHGCTVIVCSRNTNVIMVWEWMHLLSHALGTRTLLWFGHGCTSNRMLAEHERYYGLGMVALFIVCSVIVCFGTRTLLWFGHGCAIVCSRNTNVIMVWAWMHLFSYALRTRT